MQIINRHEARLSFARPSSLRLLWARVIVAVSAVLCTNLIHAQTQVSGAIEANTQWIAANSPYVISGEVVLQGGAALGIEAGVVIYMAEGARLKVLSGSVQALGSATSPIQVISNKTRLGQVAAPGDWEQWILTAGTANTKLEHVLFEHGRGLVIQGSSPVLNSVEIRNSLGAAIAIDLQASPTGVGNKASGNTLNGIAVPAGDITSTVRWGLRGIPYIVSSGTVSVGASPAITSIAPMTIEQGQTATLTINGSRLTGMTNVSFDRSGLATTPFTGGSSSQVFVQLQAGAAAQTGLANLRMQVDAGEILFPNAITVTPPMPAITALEPSTVLAGAGATEIVVTGRNFATTSEVLVNSAAIATAYVGQTQLRATLPNQTATGTLQVQVRTPDAAQPGQYLHSSAASLVVQAPVPPTVAVEPTPIALPPDGKPREVTIRLSKADYRDVTLNLSISDTSKATVSPASVLIPAGQTFVKITITPKASGTVTLVADSPTLTRVSVPLFITTDYSGASTAFAAPVGVVVSQSAAPVTREYTLANSTVGVAVGGVLSRVAPAAWAVGTPSTLTIEGVAIPAGAQATLVPATGVTVGATTVNAEGTVMTVALDTAADAPVGPRRIVVLDAAGKQLVFADPAKSTVQLMTGLPAIDSIEPIFSLRGTRLSLLVRGTHLQQGQLRLLPGTGVLVDTAPTISADGKQLTVLMDIAADAPVGARAVQIVTPAGASAAEAGAANSFTVVGEVRNAVTPVASGLVGVVVETDVVQKTDQRMNATAVVGVLTGTGITEVAPHTGVIGYETLVTVRGSGLQGVSAVAVKPAGGIALGTPTINADGTEMSFLVTVDAAAAIGSRRLVLTGTDGKPVIFLRPTDASFLISAPIPELIAVAPQVALTGQAGVSFSVRGRNFTNVSAVRIEPTNGITIQSFTVNSTESLTFTASIAAGATSGERAVVVTTAAGDSATGVQPGNLVRIATQVGPTYTDLLTLPVGVVVGSASPVQEQVDTIEASPAVGVLVGQASTPVAIDGTVASARVGVIVGSAAKSLTPAGWLQGANGNIEVQGVGLDVVTAASVQPSTGLLLGAPSSFDSGIRLSIPVSVAPDAAQVARQLHLTTASGARVSFVLPDGGLFGIGSMPTISSVSPITVRQGETFTLTVRGSNFAPVTRIVFSPDSGLRALSFTRSTDALGELLTVPVYVDSAAPLGSRVIQLEVPGGITSSAPVPANTINVVAPQ